MQETKTTKERILDMIAQQIVECRKEQRDASEAEKMRLDGGIAELRFLARDIAKHISEDSGS